MFWAKKKIRQENVVDDPQVLEVLQEITSRMNSTSAQLKDFSTELQLTINRLKRYAASAEKRVQENK